MPKTMTNRHAPAEIDAYLADHPDDIRAALDHIRSVVRALAPTATERVSYGVPIFRLGVDLLAMSVQKKHCSLHVMSTTLIDQLADEFKVHGIGVSGATIHFTPDKPLPDDLLERIIGARMRENGVG